MKLKLKQEFRGLQIGNVDAEKRIVEFSASSEYPVERYDGEHVYREILSHDPADVDLSRMLSAPVLDTHGGDVIGVVETCEIREKRLFVSARFSNGARASEILADIADGIRRNVSVGYVKHSVVNSRKCEDGKMEIRFRWTPYEVSFVPVPADPTVGVGREIEFIPEEEKRTETPEKNPVKVIILT